MSIAPDIPADRQAALAFDLKRLDPAFLADPFPLCRALREHDPDPSHAGWVRVSQPLRRLRRGLPRPRGLEPSWTWTHDFRPNFGDGLLYEHHTTSLVFNDPPYHSRVRKLLAPAFAPRAPAALQPRIEALVERLIDQVLAHRAGGGARIDLDRGSRCRQSRSSSSATCSAFRRTSAAKPRGWSLAILGALEPALSPEQLSPRRHGRGGIQGLPARSRRAAPARAARRRQRDPVDADRRQRIRSGRGRRRARAAERARAPAQLHIHPQRRSRDHQQPDRQRRRSADPPSRRAARAARHSPI